MEEINNILLSEEVIDECLQECLEPMDREYSFEDLRDDDIRK